MNQINIQSDNTQPANHDLAISANQSNSTKHFIDDDIFQRLLALRETVYQATEVNISPRKLVNMILQQADLSALCEQLIQRYQ